MNRISQRIDNLVTRWSFVGLQNQRKMDTIRHVNRVDDRGVEVIPHMRVQVVKLKV